MPEGFQGTIGTVSHGTLRTADLIAAFADEVENIEPDHQFLAATKGLILKAKACSMMSSGADQELEDWCERIGNTSDLPQYVLDNLIAILEDHAPDGYWFGNTEGDPTDYGFWELSEAELPEGTICQDAFADSDCTCSDCNY